MYSIHSLSFGLQIFNKIINYIYHNQINSIIQAQNYKNNNFNIKFYFILTYN